MIIQIACPDTACIYVPWVGVRSMCLGQMKATKRMELDHTEGFSKYRNTSNHLNQNPHDADLTYAYALDK